ncbi:MAG TPA: hypothetical protein VHS09_16135, partial [Polyangiaceae bacterium]|nr:hypothetical protein [Polyangiaceae bacterium]
MTDDKKLPDGLEDVDWDQALSEWENKTFVPEVAKDVATDKPGALSGGPVSKPLYRPSGAAQPPRPKPAPPLPPRPLPSAASRAPQPPPAPPPPPSPPSAPPEPPIEDDDEAGATVIAAIPRELLRGEETAPKSGSRGGLGQMFARDEKRDASVSVDVSFDESQPRVPAAAPPPAPAGGPAEGEVVTSAKAVVPARPSQGDAPPLRRPSQVDATEAVPDGARFDPFADDEEPRSAQSTRPAEEEVDDLLAQSSPPPAPLDGAAAEEPVPASTTQVMPAKSEPPAKGPALLVPEARKYDPNEETMVGSDADIARARASLAAKRVGPGGEDDDDEEPTGLEARTAAAIDTPTRSWPGEKPASAWLSETARDTLAARAAWLEEEARALGDKVARARGLLACSEILATVGERERAQTLAAEARDLAPSLALAHRQARALMPSPPDPEDFIEALDVEVKMTPAGPARIHSTLLASEALRAAGDEEAAVKRLDQAARITTGDVRAPVARAARALARGETASAALRLSDAPELVPLADAINLALRLRGVERKEVASSEPSANEVLL